MKKMKRLQLLLFCFCAATLSGCYSTARHVATVRPGLVKPDVGIAQKYRLERIVLKKSEFSRKVAGGYEQFSKRQKALDAKKDAEKKKLSALYKESMSDEERRAKMLAAGFVWNGFGEEQVAIYQERKEYESLLKEDKKSGPNGTHAADTAMVFDTVKQSLLLNYPTIFTEDLSATPLAIVVDWATEYKRLPDYASIFSGWFWPEAAEQETVYLLFMVENPGNKSDTDLWKGYLANPKKYPKPLESGSAVRISEVWESALLPTGFIPCPGETDFPKTYCFMRCGKDSLVSEPADKIKSRKCFRDMVFEPKVDGEVLAAAIMRIINKKHRMDVATKMMKEGAR